MAKNPKSSNQLELPVLASIVKLSPTRKRDEPQKSDSFESSMRLPREASNADLEIFRSIADGYFRTTKK